MHRSGSGGDPQSVVFSASLLSGRSHEVPRGTGQAKQPHQASTAGGLGLDRAVVCASTVDADPAVYRLDLSIIFRQQLAGWGWTGK